MSLHRYATMKDPNHATIVAAFRALGCSVQSLSAPGLPDLLVGIRGVNLLVEVKDGTAVPSRQKLTDVQLRWHLGWLGQVAIVRTVEQAQQLVRKARERVATP